MIFQKFLSIGLKMSLSLMNNKGSTQQQIYGIWQIVLKMNILAINKISRKLKMMRSKMPNAAYSTRYRQVFK